MQTELLPRELEEYLSDDIPLTRAMAVPVVPVHRDGAMLKAPLEPNINHRDSVFGGSAASLAGPQSAFVKVRTRRIED